MGGCGETNCDTGFSLSLSQGDGGASPRSYNSRTSHSNNQSGGTGSDCLLPSCCALGGDRGRKSKVCDILKMCSTIVPLREVCAWGMAYLPTSCWAPHAAAR